VHHVVIYIVVHGMVDRLKVITSRNFHALLTSVSSQNGSSNKRGNNGKIIG